MNKVVIDHFSDLLCVWAYAAQIRIDELKSEFGEQVHINYHFMPVFGVVDKRIGMGWQEKGGYAGFGEHVHHVCEQFPHVQICDDIWCAELPKSSASPHLFLKAVQLLEGRGEISAESQTQFDGRTLFEEIAWQLRLAFFRDNKNIAHQDIQLALASKMALPTGLLIEALQDGSAIAELCRDVELVDEYKVSGSPSYVLNEGRQKLYGNVGYKVIAANVQEIISQPNNQASWC